MQNIAFLDGGLGQEINKRSGRDRSHPLWSVQAMIEEPELVVAVHKDFLRAGARVITANNYSATSTRLAQHELADKFFEIHQLSASLAHQAIAETFPVPDDQKGVNVAGVLPPLVASYHVPANQNYQDCYDQYCSIIAAQADHVEVFLVETMSSITEARAALSALKAAGRESFLGLTLKDDLTINLRSGEPLAQAIDVLGENGVDAICINCSSPETIDNALAMLSDSGLRFGAYANAFKSVEPFGVGSTVDSLYARTDLTPIIYTEHALGWVKRGATIIGGCCEVGPGHVAHLHDTLRKEGFQPTALV